MTMHERLLTLPTASNPPYDFLPHHELSEISQNDNAAVKYLSSHAINPEQEKLIVEQTSLYISSQFTSGDMNSHSSAETPSSSRLSSFSVMRKVINAYAALTKPRVIELLLVAALPTMLLADRGHIHLMTMVWTLFGGWLGAASANSLNMVVDADIDSKMKRTKKRPLAQHIIEPKSAFIFGIILGICSITLLYVTTNVLSAALILLTILFYVIVYTICLKRRTWQNVIWGGAAGCMPALIGWTALTDQISWQPLILFLVVFFWTPPHTWALAMHYRSDYHAAGIPMLPVLRSERHVTRQMLIYTILTVLVSLTLIKFTGILYAIAASTLGLWFILSMLHIDRLAHHGKKIYPMKTFLLSNIYLALLCCALALDSLLHLPLLFS